MFYDTYRRLCFEKGVSESKAAQEIGLNRSAVVKWRSGTVPSGTTVQKLAEYFNVSADCLLGQEHQKEKALILTKKDECDIAKDLEKMQQRLENGEGLMFDGDPLSDEAKDSILQAMKLGMQAAKLKNKEKYTPHKYKEK